MNFIILNNSILKRIAIKQEKQSAQAELDYWTQVQQARQANTTPTEEVTNESSEQPTGNAEVNEVVNETSEQSNDSNDTTSAETNQPNGQEYKLSDEVDEYGNHYVLSSDNSTDFGIIDEESGLLSAPIKLSLGDNTVDNEGVNHGYGLLHIEAERGKAIRDAGYNSVQDFVESVAKNYTVIREGGIIANNQTYLLELIDDHNNTLFIQLSKNGKYWTINSAGIFRKKYSRNKRKVYDRPALSSDTNTNTSGVNSGNTEGVTTPAGNSPKTSTAKGTESAPNNQENKEENTEKNKTNFRLPEQEQTPKAESQGKTKSIPFYKTEQFKKELKAEASRRRKELNKVSKAFAEELKNNPDIVMVQSVNDLPKEATATMSKEELRNATAAKGWFVGKDGKAYIMLENAENNEDLTATLFHEAVAHKGIRELLGEKNFNKLCQAVYDAMPEADRERIRFRENYARDYYDKNGNLKPELDEKDNVKKDENGRTIYKGVSSQLIADEYMAELAEEISKSKGKTTIAEDIVQAIRTFLRKIGINLDINQNDVRHILHASYSKLQGKDADVMNTALGNKIKQTAVRGKIDNGIRGRFEGITGVTNLDKAEGTTTRQENYTIAENMEKSGKDAKEIKLATGWERGADGKWRYEVADDYKLIPPKTPIVTLAELIGESDNLFKSYPQLKDWDISFRPEDAIVPTYRGYCQSFFNLIWLNPNLSEDQTKSTLAHELQHAIQNIEGFVNGAGGNLGEYLFMPKSRAEKAYKRSEPLREELKSLENKEKSLLEKINSISNKLFELREKGVEDTELKVEQIKLENELLSIYEESFRVNDHIAAIYSVDALSYYEAQMGEVESRNVQTRMDMTLEERRQTLASKAEDVERENQIDNNNGTYEYKTGLEVELPSETVIYDYIGDQLAYKKTVSQNGEYQIERWSKHGLEYKESNNLIEQFNHEGFCVSREHLKNGVRDGVREKYNNYGELILRENYKNGKLDGVSEEFDEQGNRKLLSTYKEGKLNGKAEQYENGNLVRQAEFRDDIMVSDKIVEHTRFRLSDSRLRKLEDGEVCNVERIFTENKNFDFTSGERIESFDDVAFIFKQLQDESVENSFAVLVKDGVPTVIHLGMGGYTSTTVNGSALSVAVERVQPDKIYFVHNHPSGALKASAPDLNILYNLKKVYGDKVVQDGIIINLHSGKYGTFGNVNEEHKEKNIENAVPIKVFSFNKQVFKEDYNPSELFSAMSAENVASFISSQRLGKRNKLGVLVCNSQLGIVGNIFTKYTEVTNENAKEVAKDIVYYTTSMGGNRAIIFGDGFFKDITNKRLSDYVRESSLSNIELLDYVNVNDSGYLSANEEGVRFSIGGNKGYVGYSMSVRAAQAREEGRYPKTDFLKEYGVSAKALQPLVDAGIISDREWHHTSKFGNKTTFYAWEEEEYADIYQDNKKEIDRIVKGKNEDGTTFIEEVPTNPYSEEKYTIPQGYWEYRNSLKGSEKEIQSALKEKYPEMASASENNRLYHETEQRIKEVEANNQRAIAEKLKEVFANKDGVRFRLIGEKSAEFNDLREGITARMDNLAKAKEMLKNGEHIADILSATDWTLRNGEWKYREKKGKRYITNYDLSKDEIKAIQEYIESLPKDTEINGALYFENNGYIYKFDTSIAQYEDNRKSGRHGFRILGKLNLNKLTDEQRNYIQRGSGKDIQAVSRLAKGFKTSGGGNIRDILDTNKTDTTVRPDGLVSGRIGEENTIGSRDSSESIQDSRDGEITPYDSEAGVNFRLTEETDNTLTSIEQRNSEAYDSVTRVELPKADTPMEIARNKKAEQILFRFDKDFASMEALQNAMRQTELWKYNQEGKAGELNRGLYDSMAQLANLIKTTYK